MKFKWNGPEGMVDITLVMKNILPAEDTLKPGQIIEIKDDDPLIKRLLMNANWVEVEKTKPKKEEFKKKVKGGGD